MGNRIDIGTPANDSEKRVFDFLAKNLPPEYTFFTNLKIAERGRDHDFDAVIIAPHTIYVLEIKDYNGRITGNNREWILQGGKKVLPTPLEQAEDCAKIFRSHLKSYQEQFAIIPVQACVCTAGSESVNIDGIVTDASRKRRIHWYKEIIPYLTGKIQLDRAKVDITHLHESIKTGILEGLSIPNYIKGYRIEKGLWSTTRYRAYFGKNEKYPYEYVLKVYTIPNEIQEIDARAFAKDLNRDLNALRKIGEKGKQIPSGRENVVVGIEAMYEPTLKRYVVVMEGVTGILLRDVLRKYQLSLQDQYQIAAQLCRGLALAHNTNVIHRNLHPENILRTKDGVVKIINFDFAKFIDHDPRQGTMNLSNPAAAEFVRDVQTRKPYH
jgi:hypothetical protein